MSNVLNDLIITDSTGFSVSDVLNPGSGLTGVVDSTSVTALGGPAEITVGDTFTLADSVATLTDINAIVANVTYTDGFGATVTTEMKFLVLSLTDSVTGAVTQTLLPADATGDMVHITQIEVTEIDVEPGMTSFGFADVEDDNTVSLAGNDIIDGTGESETVDNSFVDADGDSIDNSGNVIEANGGNDTVFAGNGDDKVSGGDGQDWLFGAGGNDEISGNGDNDSIWGQAGDDTLLGNEGDDKLIGGNDDDLLVGGEGNNLMYGDDVFGDVGGWDPSDSPEAGYGNDTLVLGNGDDTAFGGSGDDSFRVFDGFGNHQITGGEAGETIGDKIDATLMTEDTTVVYTGDEHGTMNTGSSGTTTFSEIENIFLGTGDDTATVQSSTTGYVNGGTGFDTLELPDAAPGDPAPVVTVM